MNGEADLLKLYSQRILSLAADIPFAERLDTPQASAKKRAPLCGSTVTVDLDLDESGRIVRFGQDVKACALGQASAALMAAHILGRDEAELRRARDQLKAMLQDGAAPPTAPFTGFDLLEPAQAYKNRHASIMLAFEATLAAIDAAKTPAAP